MILPPVAFWAVFLRTPSISPGKAKQLIADWKEEVILVDVTTPSRYEKLHLKGAVNIPLDEISSRPRGAWTGMLKGKKHILLICPSGLLSAFATDKLRELGFDNALNVEGGMDAWRAGGKRGRGDEIILVMTPLGEMDAAPQLQFTLLEQITVCVAAFGLKPLYTIFSLSLALVWLRKKKEADLVALRRSMLAFFFGENACAVNFLFFNEQSLLAEYLHDYGMLVCFSFAMYALMKAMDARIIKFTDPKAKCALLPHCEKCYKYQDIGCQMRELFLFAIPATAIIALMPLTAEIGGYFHVGDVFGDNVVFGHTALQQYIEVRLCPLAALLFFAASFIILFRREEKGIGASKVYYAAGLGALGFSLMRLLTYWGYSANPIWADSWEEITEFLFIVSVLWIILRRRAERRDP
ncbi:MAG: rhodanese-like domain-containing protein [Desulfobacterales bacterium]|nr:rhodanese-like domain-containing protein [Desulfobacterales bacterium]